MKLAILIAAVMCIAGFSGCGSIPVEPTEIGWTKMHEASLVSAPQATTALVTFVRPSVFLGGAVNMDIWDGERFIGVLGSGTMVQYAAEPGEHLFLGNAENWSYTTANLLPGKRYFIKANVFPGLLFARFALGAVPKTDSRIQEWLSTLTPMTALPADIQAYESKYQNRSRSAVSDFKAGKVTSFSELHPEDGL